MMANFNLDFKVAILPAAVSINLLIRVISGVDFLFTVLAAIFFLFYPITLGGRRMNLQQSFSILTCFQLP